MTSSSKHSNSKIEVRISADLSALIPAYLEHRRDDVRELQAACSRGDLLRIQRIGHRMKGSGGSYGFDVISEIGAALEASLMNEDGSITAAAIARLEDYLARIEVVFC